MILDNKMSCEICEKELSTRLCDHCLNSLCDNCRCTCKASRYSHFHEVKLIEANKRMLELDRELLNADIGLSCPKCSEYMLPGEIYEGGLCKNCENGIIYGVKYE